MALNQTPSLAVADLRARAHGIRQRLNEGDADIEALARQALDVFASLNLPEQARWLGYELGGYTEGGDARPLHELLGLTPDHRLVTQAKSYRAHQGVRPDEPDRATIVHFFVEPVHDLVSAQRRVRAVQGRSAPLASTLSTHRRPGEFAADVFDRILLGLRATLHLEFTRMGI